jgi:acetyltransferase
VQFNLQFVPPGRKSTALLLGDGRSVAIRSLRPTDRDALRSFFQSLGAVSRRRRFHLAVNELPEALLHTLAMVDDCAHVAFVAETPHRAPGQPAALVAEARYVRDAGSDSAEVALVVAEGWRRVGLGTALARKLLRHARLAGLRRLFFDVLWDNGEILCFVRSLSARATTTEQSGDTVRLCVEV